MKSNWKSSVIQPPEIGKEFLIRFEENGEKKYIVSARRDENCWDGYGRDVNGIVEWTEILD